MKNERVELERQDLGAPPFAVFKGWVVEISG
jgi:hypothetical protein